MYDSVCGDDGSWQCVLNFLDDFGAGDAVESLAQSPGKPQGNCKAAGSAPFVVQMHFCGIALAPKSFKNLRAHCQLPSSPHTPSYIFSF
ncbi:hypothetical protein NL676_009505 [Syzygium grande]|nr:hypothetical protein NL676_009505 [Syzygium grande]